MRRLKGWSSFIISYDRMRRLKGWSTRQATGAVASPPTATRLFPQTFSSGAATLSSSDTVCMQVLRTAPLPFQRHSVRFADVGERSPER